MAAFQQDNAEIQRLEKLYDDGKITYAQFEARTRDLILTPTQLAAREKQERWQNMGGWPGFFRRILLGFIALVSVAAAIAGGAYLFFGVEFWTSVLIFFLVPVLPTLLFGLKDGL